MAADTKPLTEGRSVNDGISENLSSVSYSSVDEVVARICHLGRGYVLAKTDVTQAYRNIPVHPEDSMLLGMHWEGKWYVDKTLPFGLRSAPPIFSAVADAMQWVMEQQGIKWVWHYVDDFIMVGAPRSIECARNVEVIHRVCRELNVPMEPEKDEGAATTITFLGLELDSINMEVRLPKEKLQKLKALILSWRGRKAGKKRDLLSLIGLLTHAGRPVRPGRAYVRRLINLSTLASQLDHFVRVNKEARVDLEWWHYFLEKWNGTAMMWNATSQSQDIVITSDPSGNWGCGAYSDSEWFMLP